MILKDFNWGDRSSQSLASLFLEDTTIKKLFSDEEILYIQKKTGSLTNEITKILCSASNDVPTHLISSWCFHILLLFI